jgi:hypothetical protein
LLRGARAGDGWRFHAISAETARPSRVTPDFPASEDSLPNPSAALPLLDHLLDRASSAGLLRNAVVAIDTDTSLMSKRFSGNTNQATAWIADLFAQMNVMHERDLDVHLQRATTFLHTNADPFANADTSATSAQRSEFVSCRQANDSRGGSAVNRAFASLLSGNSPSGHSSAGIAWVNSYCQTSASEGATASPDLHQSRHWRGIGCIPCRSRARTQLRRKACALQRRELGRCSQHPCDQSLSLRGERLPFRVGQLSDIGANTPSCLGLGAEPIFAHGFQ